MPTINLVVPTNVVAATPFVVTGTLDGYTAAPRLGYSDAPTLAVPAPLGVEATSQGMSVTVTYAAVTPTITAPTWNDLPTGATVTGGGVTGTFSFTHPGIAVGTQAIAVADKGNATIASYAVYTVAIGDSPDATTVMAPGVIVGSDGTKWSINPAAQVTANAVADATTANVVELYYHKADHRVYHKNTSNAWYWKVKVTDPWTFSTAAPV